MNINYAIKIDGNVSTDSISLAGGLETNHKTITGSLVCSTVSRDIEPYEGPYVIEPDVGTVLYGFSAGDMTLNTDDKRMTANVVIKPVAPTQELNFAKVTNVNGAIQVY